MVQICFVGFDGSKFKLEAAEGSTLMENAVHNSIPGIDADCGGICACATCHVYIDETWLPLLQKPEPLEEDMLDFAYEVRPNSRLACQIKINQALDGLVVQIPERQI